MFSSQPGRSVFALVRGRVVGVDVVLVLVEVWWLRLHGLHVNVNVGEGVLCWFRCGCVLVAFHVAAGIGVGEGAAASMLPWPCC